MKLVEDNKLQVASVKQEQGYSLVRGKTPLKTPVGHALIVPTGALAEAIAAEWAGQGAKIRKELLKLTPLACVALDLVADRREAVLADVVPYIDTDLVCYRAGEINVLLTRQQQLLDPIMAWIRERYGIVLTVTGGLMPVGQPLENSQRLADILNAYDNWKLAAFSVAVKPLGSAVLALALVEGRLSAEAAFTLAHLEETYETQKWGEDAEKERYLSTKREDTLAVERFLNLLKS
jgi:chaperone required for assembly of F1-ATPase